MRQLIGAPAALRFQEAFWLIRRFWGWWTEEIAALVPAGVKTYFRGETPLIVQVHPEGFSFSGTGEQGLIVPFAQKPDALPPSLRAHFDGAGSAVLLLPPGQVLRRVLNLPLAALSDLASAIPFQLARQTPFPVEKTLCAYRMVRRDKASGTLRVELAMTEKSRFERICGHLAEMGVHLSATRIADDDGTPPFTFETRPDARRRAWSNEPWKAILAAACVIAFAGPCFVAWHLHRAADAAEASVIESAKAARAAEGLQRELQKAISSSSFLRRRAAGPHIIEILRAATAALPDDSWVFNLDIKDGNLRLNGYSANVRAVVERLQAVPIFETIEFPSPIVHDLARKQDRFDILIHVQGNPKRIYAAH